MSQDVDKSLLLTDGEFSLLTVREQDEYLKLLEEDLTAWSLQGNERQMRANILLKKVALYPCLLIQLKQLKKF